MELTPRNYIRVNGIEQVEEMKQRLESTDETYSIMSLNNRDEYYFVIFEKTKDGQTKEFVKDRLNEMIDKLHGIKLLDDFWNRDLKKPVTKGESMMTSELYSIQTIIDAIGYLKDAEEIKSNPSTLFDKPHEYQCKHDEEPHTIFDILDILSRGGL